MNLALEARADGKPLSTNVADIGDTAASNIGDTTRFQSVLDTVSPTKVGSTANYQQTAFFVLF